MRKIIIKLHSKDNAKITDVTLKLLNLLSEQGIKWEFSREDKE